MVNNCCIVGRKNYVGEKQGNNFTAFLLPTKGNAPSGKHLDMDYFGILNHIQKFVENISCLVITKGTLLAFACNFFC